MIEVEHFPLIRFAGLSCDSKGSAHGHCGPGPECVGAVRCDKGLPESAT